MPSVNLDSGMRHRIRETLGVSADIVGVAVVVIAAGPAVVAYITGSLTLALVLIVVFLVLAAAWLLYRVRALNRERRRLVYAGEHSAQTALLVYEILSAATTTSKRELARLQAAADQGDDASIGQGVPDDGVATIDRSDSPWLPDRSDLRSLALSGSEIGRCCDRAIELVRSSLNVPDLKCQLRNVVLRLEGPHPAEYQTPIVLLSVASEQAKKHFTVRFRGSLDSTEMIASRLDDRPRMRPLTHLATQPWVDDPTWLQLVHTAWARMEPFDGTVFLYYVARDIAAPYGLWRVTFRHQKEGKPAIRELTVTTFAFRSGQLEEVSEAR